MRDEMPKSKIKSQKLGGRSGRSVAPSCPIANSPSTRSWAKNIFRAIRGETIEAMGYGLSELIILKICANLWLKIHGYGLLASGTLFVEFVEFVAKNDLRGFCPSCASWINHSTQRRRALIRMKDEG